jgi:predicted signal transduction protein with EAL and GGDEF domain
VQGALLWATEGDSASILDAVEVAGVAMCESAEHDAEELLRRADAAMYQAKRNGRSRFESYGPGIELRPGRREVDADLRQAIDDFVQRAVSGS